MFLVYLRCIQELELLDLAVCLSKYHSCQFSKCLFTHRLSQHPARALNTHLWKNFLETCACIPVLPSDHFKAKYINMSPDGNVGVKECII